MKFFLLPLLFCAMLFFCTCQERAPEPTMEREKLIAVLVDVHLAEAAIANIFGSVRDSLADVYYNQIYQIHQIDSLVFQEQVSIIRKNPPYLKALYEDVLTEVNKLDMTKIKRE